ncbi:MAG: iron-containing alcohol dehydrogenase [Clostridia bacterium]|nr:iron-containing alcohol dehydrogenase [Clostridia bacterium]
MRYGEFVNKVKVICGTGSVDALPTELLRRGAHSVLLICDNVGGAPSAIKDAFDKAGGIKIKAAYTGSTEFADNKLINELYDIYTLNQCDCIVVSGGSGITNTAKLLRMMLSTGVRNIDALIGMDYIHSAFSVPFAAVPSVLDVGVDATKIAVYLSGNRLIQLVSDEATPDCCVIDSAVMKDVAKKDMGLSCIGILSCAISAYIGMQSGVISDEFSLESVKIIADHAIAALEGDAHAIGRVGEAAVLTGIAVSNSMVGLTAAVASSITSITGVKQSEALPCVLAHCLRWEEERLKDKFARLLYYVAGGEVYLSTADKERGDECCNRIQSLICDIASRCDISVKLSELGVDESAFSDIVDAVEVNGAILSCAPHIGKSDIAVILDKSY